MTTLTAQQLKRGGITALERAMSDTGETAITSRGRLRYVVMNLDVYNRMRELELEAALREAQADVRAKRYVEEGVAEHIRRISS